MAYQRVHSTEMSAFICTRVGLCQCGLLSWENVLENWKSDNNKNKNKNEDIDAPRKSPPKRYERSN